MLPSSTPKTRPVSALMPTPSASRFRLAPVSAHNSNSPLRLLGSNAMRCTASPKLAKEGNSLSLGLASSRAWEAAR